MGLVYKRLGKGLITPTTVATSETIVTNATSKDTIITKIHLYNSHSSAVNVFILVVDDSGGSVGTGAATDVVLGTISVPATGNVILGSQDCGMALTDTNDTLQMYASAADKVYAHVWGFTTADQS